MAMFLLSWPHTRSQSIARSIVMFSSNSKHLAGPGRQIPHIGKKCHVCGMRRVQRIGHGNDNVGKKSHIFVSTCGYDGGVVKYGATFQQGSKGDHMHHRYTSGLLYVGLLFTLAACQPVTSRPELPTLVEHKIPTHSAHAGGIKVGSDGALWFAETGANQIGRITVDGEVTEYPVPTEDALDDSQGFVALGPDGAIWFNEDRVNKLGRISPDGAVTEYDLPPGTSADSRNGRGAGQHAVGDGGGCEQDRQAQHGRQGTGRVSAAEGQTAVPSAW